LRGGVLLVCTVLAGTAVPAQSEFAAAYEHAERVRAAGEVSEDEVGAAYREALRAFLAMPEELAHDAAWLPAGAFSAWRGDRAELAADLFIESMRAGNQDEFHAEHVLLALLAAGRYGELLQWARDLEGRFAPAVRRVLVDENGTGCTPAARGSSPVIGWRRARPRWDCGCSSTWPTPESPRLRWPTGRWRCARSAASRRARPPIGAP
jgi:hypothetical protein